MNDNELHLNISYGKVNECKIDLQFLLLTSTTYKQNITHINLEKDLHWYLLDS